MPRTFLAGPASVLLLLAVAVSAAPVTSDRFALGLPPAGEIHGELVELQAAGKVFLAIHRSRQRGDPRGGVVLLPDRGTTANSLEVMRPLRLGLAEAGWETLSLQLSSAGGGQADAADTRARLQAGLDWLKTRKLTRLVVIALGDSGTAALAFAADKPPQELRALVLVSANLNNAAGPQHEIRPPVLEVYAEYDRPAVLDGVAARRGGMAGNGDVDYTQRLVPGARAGYFGLEPELLSRVRGWLGRQAATAD